jgi:hypothetical protein
MKSIYKFHWDCGRQGDITSVFVSTPEKVAEIIGKEVYFGEILGKHSEISGVIKEDEITLVTDNQEFIRLFEGYKLANGPNPFHYLNE